MVNCYRYHPIYHLQILENSFEMVIDWNCCYVYIFSSEEIKNSFNGVTTQDSNTEIVDDNTMNKVIDYVE